MERGKAVGARRMGQWYVRLEGRIHLETFENLSEVVLGEGESHGYQKVSRHGLSGGKRSYQGDEEYYPAH